VRAALVAVFVACASAPPPPAAAPSVVPAKEEPRDLRFRCLSDRIHAAARIGPEGEAEYVPPPRPLRPAAAAGRRVPRRVPQRRVRRVAPLNPGNLSVWYVEKS